MLFSEKWFSNFVFSQNKRTLSSSFFMEVCWVSWLEEGRLGVLQHEFIELSQSMSLAHYYYWPYKFLKRLVQVSSSYGLVLSQQQVSRDFGQTIFLLFNQHSNLNSVAKQFTSIVLEPRPNSNNKSDQVAILSNRMFNT